MEDDSWGDWHPDGPGTAGLWTESFANLPVNQDVPQEVSQDTATVAEAATGTDTATGTEAASGADVGLGAGMGVAAEDSTSRYRTSLFYAAQALSATAVSHRGAPRVRTEIPQQPSFASSLRSGFRVQDFGCRG